MQIKKITVDDFLKYLSEKYEKSFEFHANGIDAWYSKRSTAIFKDPDGKKFQVRYSAEGFSDNYTTVLFDEEIEKHLASAIQYECKLFANTRTFFSGADQLFSDYEDYLEDSPIISVRLYVKEENIRDSLVERMVTIFPHSLVSCVVHVLDEELYRSMKRDTETPVGDGVIDVYSFSLENGDVVCQSWEGNV